MAGTKISREETNRQKLVTAFFGEVIKNKENFINGEKELPVGALEKMRPGELVALASLFVTSKKEKCSLYGMALAVAHTGVIPPAMESMPKALQPVVEGLSAATADERCNRGFNPCALMQTPEYLTKAYGISKQLVSFDRK